MRGTVAAKELPARRAADPRGLRFACSVRVDAVEDAERA